MYILHYVDSSTQPRPRHTNGIELPALAAVRSQVSNRRGGGGVKFFLFTSLRSTIVNKYGVQKKKENMLIIIMPIEENVVPL